MIYSASRSFLSFMLLAIAWQVAGAEQQQQKQSGALTNISGVQAAESVMPPSITTNLGSMVQKGLSQKKQLIQQKGQMGLHAAGRLGEMMSSSMQHSSKSAAPMMMMMPGQSLMMGAHEAMQKGLQDIKGQLQQSMSGHMDRMQQMHGLGEGMQNQVQGITRTLTDGLQRSASELHKTGEQVMSQLQGGMKKNGQAMQGLLGSMHGSMGGMGQNMQKNVQGLVQHVQSTAMQLTDHLQQAVQGPMNMLSSLGSSLGSMMGGKGMGGGGGGGRY